MASGHIGQLEEATKTLLKIVLLTKWSVKKVIMKQTMMKRPARTGLTSVMVAVQVLALVLEVL